MVGCLFAVFRFIWKITKLVLKLLWKILRFVLFRLGFICVGLYLLAAFIIEAACKIGLSFKGELNVWYCIGLGLSIICTAIFIIRYATRKDREERKNE